MHKIQKIKFSLTLGLIMIQTLNAQEKGTFRGYINSGFIINQIAGDSVAGFNYWGYTGGAGTYFMLDDNLSANLEVNYSMKGASGEVFDELNNFIVHRTIHTNYIEIPVMINYHDHKIARFGGGLVVSSLIDTKQWYNKLQVRNDRIQDYYKTIDFSFVASVAFDIKRHFGVNIRMLHSILPANKSHLGEPNQFHMNLSARALYYF